MSDTRRVAGDTRHVARDTKGGSEDAMSNAVTEANFYLNELARLLHRGQGDTLGAARDRAARVAGIDRSYAKRIWDRWQTMNDVSGEAYRRLREAYERACERHEAAAAEYRQQRLLIEATRHAVSESPDYGGMGVPVPEMVQTTTRESAAK